ncbi:sulfite exporter TauE/SafE family protein [Baekduia soli]|uniref:Probable membrane transporter protein n=1 Tax=Baekduia soli TaxID=496014 RepID=A0A5B8U553_9ACTN|nr:sulfite exporter TauE/SafE family protein [Baekduia soli]QEC48249.1 sulfite exporter TauE/SafE family protein [Baekduia soli]
MAAAAIPFGLAIGLSLGMLGGGGSVLAVPVLVYVLGQSVHEATTTSLVVVTAGALAGGLAHAREGRVCWRHASAFTAAALPGVVAGTALGNAVSGRVLIAAFAVIMLAAAAATWRKATKATSAGDAAPVTSSCPPLRLGRDLVAGLLIGTMTGFFGVGGGFLIVPTLSIALALSMRLAVGTSLAIITATSVMALGAHLVAGRGLDAGVTTTMTLACVAGALGGVRLAGRIPQRQLGQGFAALVVLVAGYLLISAAFLGGPPGSS